MTARPKMKRTYMTRAVDLEFCWVMNKIRIKESSTVRADNNVAFLEFIAVKNNVFLYHAR